MPISVVGSQHVTPRSMGSGIGEVPGAGDASPPWRIGVVTPPSSPAHELLPATDNDVPPDFDDSIAISDDMLLTRFRTDIDNNDTVQGGRVARIAAQVDAVANADSGGLAAANSAPAPDPATAPAHVCKFCTAAFADKTSLGRHLREHSGEKPWICTWDGCTKRVSPPSVRRRVPPPRPPKIVFECRGLELRNFFRVARLRFAGCRTARHLSPCCRGGPKFGARRDWGRRVWQRRPRVTVSCGLWILRRLTSFS